MKITRHLPLLFVLICVVKVSAQEAVPAPKINLMPVPASVKFHPGERLAVDASFKVGVRGHSGFPRKILTPASCAAFWSLLSSVASGASFRIDTSR